MRAVVKYRIYIIIFLYIYSRGASTLRPDLYFIGDFSIRGFHATCHRNSSSTMMTQYNSILHTVLRLRLVPLRRCCVGHIARDPCATCDAPASLSSWPCTHSKAAPGPDSDPGYRRQDTRHPSQDTRRRRPRRRALEDRHRQLRWMSAMTTPRGS